MSEHLRAGERVSVLRLPRTLDASQAVRMRSRLTRLLNRNPRFLFLDLKATREVKLVGLGILIDRLKRLGNGHGEIRFSNGSPRICRTLVRAGLNGLLQD